MHFGASNPRAPRSTDCPNLHVEARRKKRKSRDEKPDHDRAKIVTVESLSIGDGALADFLVSPARAPLPRGTTLPNGTLRLLVATRITPEEMQWAMNNGRDALAKRLDEAGVGQLSTLRRGSIL